MSEVKRIGTREVVVRGLLKRKDNLLAEGPQRHLTETLKGQNSIQLWQMIRK